MESALLKTSRTTLLRNESTDSFILNVISSPDPYNPTDTGSATNNCTTDASIIPEQLVLSESSNDLYPIKQQLVDNVTVHINGNEHDNIDESTNSMPTSPIVLGSELVKINGNGTKSVISTKNSIKRPHSPICDIQVKKPKETSVS